MIILSVITVLLAVFLLFVLMMRTRGHDTVAWWLFRILITYSMICFLYLAYDTGIEGQHIEPKFLFIRMGCLALVVSMMMSWHLLKREYQSKFDSSNEFNQRINDVFNRDK